LLEDIIQKGGVRQSEPEQAERVAAVLGSFGVEADSAVPALSKAVRFASEKVFGRVAEAAVAELGNIATPSATLELQKIFQNKNVAWKTRSAAVSALAETAFGNDEKIRKTVQIELEVIAATDEDDGVRRDAKEMVEALKAGKKIETRTGKGK
jgi:HEAT repeat protein